MVPLSCRSNLAGWYVPLNCYLFFFIKAHFPLGVAMSPMVIDLSGEEEEAAAPLSALRRTTFSPDIILIEEGDNSAERKSMTVSRTPDVSVVDDDETSRMSTPDVYIFEDVPPPTLPRISSINTLVITRPNNMPILVEDEDMSTKSMEEEPFYDLISCLDSMGGGGEEVGEGITLYPSDHNSRSISSTGIAVVSAVDTGPSLPGSKVEALVEMSSAGSKRKAESTTTAAKFTRYDIERLFEESDEDGDNDDDDFEDCEISENRVRNVLQRQPKSTVDPVVSKLPTTTSSPAAVVALQARVRSVILASSSPSSSSTSEESDAARNNTGRPDTGSCNKIAAVTSSVPAGPAFVHAVRSLLLSSTSESEGSESRDWGSESRDRGSESRDRCGVIIGRDVSEEDLADSYLCTECRPCRLLQGALGTFEAITFEAILLKR
jgi:hypothetical protein